MTIPSRRIRFGVACLLLCGGAGSVSAQSLDVIPPATECIRHTSDGHCALWAPTFASVLRYPERYHNLSVRLSGYVILRCQDQTLYATSEDAGMRVRQSGIRLSGHLDQLKDLTDSVSHVVVDVHFEGPFYQDVRIYGGLADSVVLVRLIQPE